MIPLGVYCPGEHAPTSSDLRTLRDAGCTALWLNHCLDSSALDTPSTIALASEAASLGMRMVLAPSALHISGHTMGWKRTQAYYDRIIPETLALLGMAPRLALALGDEPTEVSDYRDFVATWRRIAPAEKLATVVTRGYLADFRGIGFDHVACDSYQFLEPGVPGDADGAIGSWLNIAAAQRGQWMMGQGFASPGNKRIPTPAEVTWQVYSALALGCRGVFLFVWSRDPGPENLTTLAHLPDQFAAMSTAYKRAARWGVLESAAATNWQPLPGPPGSLCGTFSAPTGKHYVLAACGPGAAATLSVPVRGWLAYEVGSRWPSIVWGGVLSVRMAAGEGRLFEVR